MISNPEWLNMIQMRNSFHTGTEKYKHRRIEKKKKQKINQNQFIYCSIFYVFYEQYLTIWRDTIFSLGISLATIFSVSFILTGFDLIAATVIALLVISILINMGGMMYAWSITLNAVSLVNLVVVSNLGSWKLITTYCVMQLNLQSKLNIVYRF